MKPIDGTRFGLGGNCYQACIASILELPLDEVPDLAPAMVAMEGTGEDWSIPLNSRKRLRIAVWLRERGLGRAEWPGVGNVRMNGHEPTEESTDSIVYRSGHRPAGWSILTGRSPRGPFLHAVVCYDGELRHDPYPPPRGQEPDGGGVLSEFSWEVIYALDPAQRSPTGEPE